MSATKEKLKGVLAELEIEKAGILSKSKPFHDKRAELVAKIQPLEAEMRAVDVEIKKLERPRLPEVCREIAQVHRALGAKSIKVG